MAFSQAQHVAWEMHRRELMITGGPYYAKPRVQGMPRQTKLVTACHAAPVRGLLCHTPCALASDWQAHINDGLRSA